MEMDCKSFLGKFCGDRKGVERAKAFQLEGRASEEKERYNSRARIILENDDSLRTCKKMT
jgi:hypothetical protein